MSNIVATISTDVITVVYNDAKHSIEDKKFNMITGYYVDKLTDGRVETNLLGEAAKVYDCSKVTSVEGVTIDTNTKLYDELCKLL